LFGFVGVSLEPACLFQFSSFSSSWDRGVPTDRRTDWRTWPDRFGW